MAASQQLFTESTLTAVLPLLTRRNSATAGAIARVWGLVLAANLFGTWCFATLLLPSAHFSRLSIVLVITYVVTLARLSHIVAGSTDAAYAVLIGLHSFGAHIVGFLLQTLIGNTIGGVALVALLNHGSIVSELKAEEEPGAAEERRF